MNSQPGTVWMFAFIIIGISQVDCISKIMKNKINSEKELNSQRDQEKALLESKKKTLNLKFENTISFEDLKKIIKPNVEITREEFAGLSDCSRPYSDWDSVGQDRHWDVVLVDFDPGPNRAAAVDRLLVRARLVILHDTESYVHPKNPMQFPADFIRTAGTTWNGRPAFTDQSDTTEVREGGLSWTTKKFTTVIQGDLDTQGSLFSTLCRTFQDHFDDINLCYRHYNVDNKDYGTHMRLLLVGTLLTAGDVLELGAGLYSTHLLHNITQLWSPDTTRHLVTVETDRHWLESFTSLQNEQHQLIYLPAA